MSWVCPNRECQAINKGHTKRCSVCGTRRTDQRLKQPINWHYKKIACRELYNQPTRSDLQSLASKCLDGVSNKRIEAKYMSEKDCDTIAIGMKDNTLYIAGNLKERQTPNAKDDIGKLSMKILCKDEKTGKRKSVQVHYPQSGIDKENERIILDILKNDKKLKQNLLKSNVDSFEVKFVKSTHEHLQLAPNMSKEEYKQQVFDHHADHAEMKILKYVEQDHAQIKKGDHKKWNQKSKKKKGDTLDAIVASKPICQNCGDALRKHDDKLDLGSIGNKRVKHHNTPDHIPLNQREISHAQLTASKYGIETNRSWVQHNMGEKNRSTKAFKQNFEHSARPGGQMGIVSSAVWAAHRIEEAANAKDNDDNFEFEARASRLNAYTMKSDGLLGVGESVGARANVYEASAGGKDLGARVSALEADAQAEYGLNNSAYANVSLARAEGYAGPVSVGVGLNLDTGAHVGVNGIGASVAGFGFSIGPCISIKTPFFDFSFNLF